MLNLRVLGLVALAGCVHRVETHTSASLRSLLAAKNRSEADRALDPGRKPLEFLAFTRVGQEMKVAELMAGGGYTTELLSRAVGPKGIVYGENPKWVLERFAQKEWSERLAGLNNIERLDRELEDPFPDYLAGQLDLVVSNAIYHDTVPFKLDRSRMNKAVFLALKMGGSYVVCDSSAKAGAGVADAETLHRIEEQWCATR